MAIAEGGTTTNAVAIKLAKVATMFQVSEKTLRREISRRKLKAVRIGRVLRVRVDEIENYLRRQEEN